MMYNILRVILGLILKLIWVEKVEGVENMPKTGGVIIASNHESYFDFLSFAALSPRPVHYLAAEKFFNGQLWWWTPLMKMTGQICVDRKSKDKTSAVQAAVDLIGKGKVFGIFPEGTRSSDGHLQKAFTGVAKIALIAKVPVVPVGIVGAFEIMPRTQNYPNLGIKMRLKIGQPIDLSEYYGKENDQEVLRFITDKIIMKRIGELAEEKYDF